MTSLPETLAQKRKRIAKRDKCRSTVCAGCRHNYYNFPKDQSENGDVAVSQEYSCWHLDSVFRGKCRMKS